MTTIGEAFKSQKSHEVDPEVSVVSAFRQLIKERSDPLDLIRELVSNSGSREVGVKSIEISYTKDKLGHIFDVLDDGCGMNFTGDKDIFPGCMSNVFRMNCICFLI